MSRVRGPLAAPDQRDIPKREARRPLQPAERDALDEREDVSLEGAEVDALAVLFVPLAASRLRVTFAPARRTAAVAPWVGSVPAAFFCSIAVSPEPWNAFSYCSRW